MDTIAKLKSTEHALTVNESAALLQVHYVTIQRWAHQQVIPSFRIGGEAEQTGTASTHRTSSPTSNPTNAYTTAPLRTDQHWAGWEWAPQESLHPPPAY